MGLPPVWRHRPDLPSRNFKFDIDGKQLYVRDLYQGMSLTGTKIVYDPETEFSSLSVITGKAPK